MSEETRIEEEFYDHEIEYIGNDGVPVVSREPKSWLRTKQIAEYFHKSIDEIRMWRVRHSEDFEGLVCRTKPFANKNILFYHPDALRIFFRDKTSEGKEWKSQVIDEVTEKGIAITKTSNIDIIKAQHQEIQNIIMVIEVQQQQLDRQEGQLIVQDERINVIEDKIHYNKADRRLTIPPLRKLVHECAELDPGNKHWYYWGKIKNSYGVDSYYDLYEHEAQEAIGIMKKIKKKLIENKEG